MGPLHAQSETSHERTCPIKGKNITWYRLLSFSWSKKAMSDVPPVSTRRWGWVSICSPVSVGTPTPLEIIQTADFSLCIRQDVLSTTSRVIKWPCSQVKGGTRYRDRVKGEGGASQATACLGSWLGKRFIALKYFQRICVANPQSGMVDYPWFNGKNIPFKDHPT